MGMPLCLTLTLLIGFRTALVLASVKTTLDTTPQLSDTFEPAQYVEPLIGSINGGHVFVGSSTPYGVVKGEWGLGCARAEKGAEQATSRRRLGQQRRCPAGLCVQQCAHLWHQSDARRRHRRRLQSGPLWV